MPETLTPTQCAELGVLFNASRMDNREHRFRLMKGENNSTYGYILTEMPVETLGEWQNSHFHKGIMETYIVQKGWIGFADLMVDGTACFYAYRPGEMFTSRPGQAHNVYMPAGAVIHTVKHGDCSLAKDWFSSPELDLLTKHISERELIALATA